MTRVFLFPGQGAQFVGMGKELRDFYPRAAAVFEEAATVLGREFLDVIFDGPEEKLRQTRFTQPALFIVSMAAHALLAEKDIRAEFTAGHSLGEYSALCAAGAFDFKTGLGLVKARGEAIQEASDKVSGTMAAIVGLERDPVKNLCREASSEGVCEPVNFNCPGQIVIAGAANAVEKAVRLAREAGSKKSVKLNVSGPFHSSLMKPAAETMAGVIAEAAIQAPLIPVVMNVDAAATTDPAAIRRNLVAQVDHPVLWEDSLVFLTQKADTFLEVGAGRVLSGLLRRIDRTKKAGQIGDKRTAEAVLAGTGT